MSARKGAQMALPRLTEEADPKAPITFLQCQLCQTVHTDICSIRIWQECDEQDKPEDRFLVACQKNPECQNKIDEHPRGYKQVEWGAGAAGRFVLLCGDCSYRKEWDCTHPKLVKNGGAGLTVHFSNMFGNTSTIICTTKGCHRPPLQGVSCEGLPIDHPRYQAAPAGEEKSDDQV